MNILGCQDVSVPVEPTNKQIVSQLKEKIVDDTYNIGQLIVPQSYKKNVLINDKLAKETTTTEGRKMDLLDIRKNMLKKQEKYMKLRTDDELSLLTKDDILQELSQINELAPNDFSKDNLFLLKKLKHFQRTKHLMMWHHGSILSSHTYLLMMVSIIYDRAVFLTNEEYEQKYHASLDIQSIIEKPQVYLLARCPSNDQQILHIEEHLQDILNLNLTITSSKHFPIKDELRIFKGDKPAAQFEAGQH